MDDDVWSYTGLKKLKSKSKSSPIAENEFEKKKKLKTVEENDECSIISRSGGCEKKLATKQTSLLSFFTSTTTVAPKRRNTEEFFDVQSTSAAEKAQNFRKNKCPFYKFAGDTPYVVDAFSYGYVDNVKAYFLSHFHSDHYFGLAKLFQMPVYCSEITANLVKFVLKVSSQFIKPLPMNEFVALPDGSEVSLIDANHCPGSVMFLFRTKTGRIYLHTGDFRADEEKIVNLTLWNSISVDVLYLDTTYCNPRYVFPRQSEIIEKTVQLVESELKIRPKLLICVGTYTIGKERIFAAISKFLDCKIFVDKRKLKILECLNDETLLSRLTLNPQETRLHVVSMNQMNLNGMSEYLSKFADYNAILAVKPTGWEFRSNNAKLFQISRRGNVTVAGIPYSEHSSCDELKLFVQALRPKRILPTVNNGSAKSRKNMQNLFDSWLQS